MNIEPISPQEARGKKQANIPPFIIDAVNKLIIAKIGESKSVKILQDEILDKIGAPRDKAAFRSQIIANKWLDFEPTFRKVGWQVDYDKPAYNEDYPASFTFTEKCAA